ncbi:DNA polymerase III subunit gamma/tau [Psychrobium sp. MM17-31]|uniref:DNA polymerase III subunit gamma/tau n=1 Tax=Psychrobium sp. MM17-31 TaxID=2917758 RepID=UPI001EF55905|nr:DNA polymerase III subunit gamma/tau [Psychrobium sp. MM17-31]MCG7531509.1 DNA polymerase III subunit gamma/tau [Psychrobium sp. MM17-31]
MSYQVLARKWRPSKFEEVVGQQHVLQALVNALEQQRLHHAYLFSGTRGVGKTSIARLLAKCLNCEVAVSASPCGECESCQQIEQGRFIDLIEIDAASRTKVEDTREILDNVQYKPTRARYKIYLIDEVHMLSRSSFNALLKTLEEPPEHVKFLFATTETQKLPVTILSRCLQFNLKALSPRQISTQLANILTAENINFDEGALGLLSQSAKGSMRDALSLTDQAISHGSGALSQDVVGQMLGTIDVDHSAQLLTLALNGDAAALFAYCEQVAQLSPDFDALLGQMIDSVHFASMAQVVKNSARLANQPRGVIALAQYDAELLQLFYSLLLQGRKELPFANDPHSGFEMVLLRLLAFKPKTINVQSDVENAEPTTNHKAEDEDQTHANMLAQEQASIMAQAQVQRSSAGPVGLAAVKAALHGEKKTEPVATVEQAETNESQAEKQGELNEQSPSTVQEHSSSIAPQQGEMTPTPSPEPKLVSAEPIQQDTSAQSVAIAPTQNTAPDQSVSDSEEPAVSKIVSSAPVPSPQSGTDTMASDPMGNAAQSANDFSDEEMLNMSMAMAHDEHEYYEPVDINQALPEHNETASSNKLSSSNLGSSNDNQAALNTKFNAGDINAFLQAKNKLKSKRESSEGDSGKKPQAVSDDLTQKFGGHLPQQTSDVIEQTVDSLPVVSPENLVAKTSAIPNDNAPVEDTPVALVEDPALLLAPNSDDPWTLMIEEMALGGRLRQLAIHSVYERTGNTVHLLLANEHRHLNAETALDALSKKLTALHDAPIELEVEIGDNEVKTPFEIAQDLHQHRLSLAADCIKADEGVLNFISQFDANLVDESIKYRTLKAIS